MDYTTWRDIVNFLLCQTIPKKLSGGSNKKRRIRFKKMCVKKYRVKCPVSSPTCCDQCLLLRWKHVTRFTYKEKDGVEKWISIEDLCEKDEAIEREVAEEVEGSENSEESGEEVVEAVQEEREPEFELRLPQDAVGMNLALDEILSKIEKKRVKVSSLVLRDCELKTAFQKFHVQGGHGGWTGLLAKVNSGYYLPLKYQKKLKAMYDKCVVCAVGRQRSRIPPPAPRSINVLFPCKMWQWDHAGPFPEDSITGDK